MKRPKGYRKLHFGKDVWFYRIGKRFVRIVNPKGKSHIDFIENFDFEWTISYDSCEIIGWDGTTIDDVPHYNIDSPSKVKTYIRKNLLAKTENSKNNS